MRTFLKSFTFIGLLTLSPVDTLHAQTVINGSRVINGSWDASKASSSKPAKTGTSLPMTCGTGEQFFKTDATQGQNLYFCTADNTWVQMTGGTGSGSGGSGGGSPSVLLYKGDLSGYANQNVRIPIGPDGSSLTADSSQGSGVSYRNASDSNTFANRPVCSPALTGQTYYPTDGILGYRCNGSTWTAFGPISPITPFRISGSNSYGVVGTGSAVLTAAGAASGPLALSNCLSFPSTVTMILVDSEIIAGTCSGTTFTPITGGRGYNQTVSSSHAIGASAVEQLFVWGNNGNGTPTQGAGTITATGGYLAITANNSSGILVRPLPNGPTSPYTVTTGFLMNGATGADQGCGMGFRQSSNNKQAFVVFHTITYIQTGFNIGEYMISDGTFIGAYFNDLAAASLTGNGLYFRFQDTLTERRVYVSSDGLNFVLIHTVFEGDFLTPDQVFLSCNASGIPQVGSFFSWTEGN